MEQKRMNRKGRGSRMKRFNQLISALAVFILLLGCMGGAAAAEDTTGSLTVTIDGNTKGVSTAGITLNLYRIGGDETGTWTLKSEFADSGYMEAWKEQSGEKMRAALQKIRGIVTDGNMTPDASAKSDNKGVISFTELPRGIYFGVAAGTPKEMTVQNFAAHIPEAGTGRMQATAALKNRVVVPQTKNPYTVTIRYIYEDGTTAWPTYHGTYWPDEIYDVYSPVIPGYTCSDPRIHGVMPPRNLQFVVIYIKPNDGTTIVEYDTPLGLGNIQIHVGVCYE